MEGHVQFSMSVNKPEREETGWEAKELMLMRKGYSKETEKLKGI